MNYSAALASVAILGISNFSFAGDLNPPVGPVAPTMKTLDEVEPRIPISDVPGDLNGLHTITSPGSYYFTENIQTPGAGQNVIRVLSEGVTIDMGGFAILGDQTENNAAIFFGLPAGEVRNGVIYNWGGSGVQTSSSVTIDSMRFDNTDGPPIDSARGSIIRSCHFRVCEALVLGGDTLVKDCVARDMNEVIIATGQKGVSIVDCVFDGQNSSGGGAMIIVGNDAKLLNVNVTNEGHSGVIAGQHSSVIGCTFAGNNSDNDNNGITVDSTCIVKDNIVFDYGGDGIQIDFSCVVTGNTILGCGGDGITSPFDQNIIKDNTIGSSGGDGISVRGRNRIEGNTISNSAGDGIVGANDNMIIGNQLANDPIRVTSSDNTIDSNTVTDTASFSVFLDAGGNRMTRNSITANVISSGTNMVGTIRTSATFGAAGPWDNFFLP